MAAIKVKLVSGLAGTPEDHRLTVWGMGLKKYNSEKILPDTPQTMGMITKVSYLIEWERVQKAAPSPRKARRVMAKKMRERKGTGAKAQA